MLEQNLLELVRKTSADLPLDIRIALAKGKALEAAGTTAAMAMDTIECNIDMAATDSAPICQDTGMIKFYVYHPVSYNTLEFQEAAIRAVITATELGYLRKNSVDSITGKNSGNNLGPGTPQFSYYPWRESYVDVRLLLKGGGCENVGAQYSLPMELPELGKRAGRDLDGVKLAVLYAMWKAQGRGCAPGYIGVCIGSDRSGGMEAAKKQLLRVVGDSNPDEALAALEKEITDISNGLGIGPMGFGGKTTCLGTKIVQQNRIPASFFVSFSYACWAHRRRGFKLNPETNEIESWLYETAEESLPGGH